MATESSGSSNGFLYFIVGAMLVAMVVFGIMYFNGGFGGASNDGPIENAAEAVGEAADEVGDAARNPS
jgi:hypothetical protein